MNWPASRWSSRVAYAGLLLAASAAAARGCPFCTALQPTWCQLREAADVAAFGELVGAGGASVRVLRVFRGGDLSNVPPVVVLDEPVGGAKPGTLAVLLGTAADGGATTWRGRPANEISLAYFVRAPESRLPPADRLRWFVPYLEHEEADLAADTYLEFGHARLEDVAAVVPELPMASVRRWLVSPQVPEERRGLYGLLLGLATKEADVAANERLLRQEIETPSIDFRSGFDGILGGYLWLAGEEALELIERRYLRRDEAAEGDIRHALTALRFYHELGRRIPRERIESAAAHLLSRPGFAPEVIIDLARWRSWQSFDRVAALAARSEYPQPATRRAVIGYLLLAPEAMAAAPLERWRQREPELVADLERELERAGGER